MKGILLFYHVQISVLNISAKVPMNPMRASRDIAEFLRGPEITALLAYEFCT